MTITKADLVTSLCDRLNISKNMSVELLESMIEIIKGTLEKGDDVLISGFGKFCVKEKDERRGRNPQTGEDMLLEARRVLTFKCSPILKNKMNEKS